MTLKEAQDKVATADGYRDFEQIAFHLYEEYFTRAALLYGESKWNQACEEQKALCDKEIRELLGINSEAPKPTFKP